MTIKRVFAQFLGGLVCSVAVSIFFAGTFNMSDTLGGDKSGVMFGIFLGMPVGSILGIVLVHKVFFKLARYSLLRISLGFILSVLAGIESLIILDAIGERGIFLAPVISTLLSLAGYSVPGLRKGK